jgi:hypothetical protein
MKTMEEMVGKTINNIAFGRIKKEKHYVYLKVECDGGDMLYYLDADCCSESYFDNIDDVFNSFPVKIESVLYIDDIKCRKCTTQDFDLGYFIFFNHNDDDYGTGASFYISFRNSSNGYYNGSIVLLGEDHPYYKANMKDIEWKYIKSK